MEAPGLLLLAWPSPLVLIGSALPRLILLQSAAGVGDGLEPPVLPPTPAPLYPQADDLGRPAFNDREHMLGPERQRSGLFGATRRPIVSAGDAPLVT
jgi:hypothetical protein